MRKKNSGSHNNGCFVILAGDLIIYQ